MMWLSSVNSKNCLSGFFFYFIRPVRNTCKFGGRGLEYELVLFFPVNLFLARKILKFPPPPPFPNTHTPGAFSFFYRCFEDCFKISSIIHDFVLQTKYRFKISSINHGFILQMKLFGLKVSGTGWD